MKNKTLLYSIALIALLALFAAKKNEVSVSDSETMVENTDSKVKTTKKNATTTGKDNTTDSKTNKTTVVSFKEGMELPAALNNRNEQIIKHVGHTVSYNKSHNTPNWSAWVLTADRTDGPNERSSKFWADPAISKSYRVEWYEYKGSGYDRGHMCPAADAKWSAEAMHDCFYMSNMCPQEPSLNSGSWKHLEETCRDWAIREGAIYIACGPVYKKGVKHEKIGTEHSIDVPEGFFKVVLSLRKDHEKAIGFYYDNTPQHQSIPKAARSVDEIEKLTGIDFFPALNDKLEERLEATYSVDLWQQTSK